MDLMEQSKRFDQIFAPVKAAGWNAGYERIGPLWQMWVYGPAGTYGGARENGESLAKELADKALGKVETYVKYGRLDEPPKHVPVPPQPLTAPLAEKPTAPVTDYDAIIAGLKAQLAEALAKAPEVVEIPEFIKLPEEIPSELADLIEYADTPAQSNEKLLARLREVLGLIGLAEDAGGRAAPELYRRRDRLESGIRFNRGRMAESL
jgi:hypothetical protein